jgi:hypothetical protein
MGNRVQRVRTEVSESQMAAAVLDAWKEMFNTTPTKEQVSLVLAQNALETGSRKSMWNYNIGNITTDGKSQYDYFDDLRTSEQTSPGVWQKMNLKYRAYPTLKDGVKDYLKLLSGKHYSNAWDHIINPDPAAFSKALKQSGYYTANEAPYTKTLSGLYGKYNKSKGYEDAVAGKIDTKQQPDQIPTKSKSDYARQFLSKIKDSGSAAVDAAKKPGTDNDYKSILNNFLHQVAASEKLNKNLYKKFLPKQNILIQVKSKDYADSIEFSRILCTALDEELMAKSFIHTDNNDVEVNCVIAGPELDCFNTVKQLTGSLAEAFKFATAKIGGVDIKTNLIMNKTSFYEGITLRAAEIQYRKFLLKFA